MELMRAVVNYAEKRAGIVILTLVMMTQSLFAFESYEFVFKGNLQLSSLEQLILLSDQLNIFESNQKKESPAKKVLAAENPAPAPFNSQAQELKMPSLTAEQQGNLPIPVAQVREPKNSQRDLQKQKWGDLGGTPYGELTGKSTFGNVDEGSSFSNLMQGRGTASAGLVPEDSSNLIGSDGSLTQEQLIEAETKLAQLKDQLSKLAFKMEPFQEMDYKSYESAKQLFMKHDKLISRINDFEEGFVRNARELFVNYSWRDMDKVGKRPYEKFIENQESKKVFPFPKGQEPKPTTHQGRISH